jgi:hypothetical protein
LALDTTLWHNFPCFSSDKSDLEVILSQAQESTSFDINPEGPELLDPCLSTDSQLIVMPGPSTPSKVICPADELWSANILLAQAKIQYELMQNNAYTAKSDCVKSKLQAPAKCSKDPSGYYHPLF